MYGYFFVSLGTLLTVAGSPASDGVRLVYHASAGGCPSHQDVAHALAANVGYNPVRPDGEITAVVTVSAAETGLAADLLVMHPDGSLAGQRRLESAAHDCAELLGGVALALSIALEPLLIPATSAPQPSESKQPVQARTPMIENEPPAPTSRPTRLSLQTFVLVGASPSWAGGLAATGDMQIGKLRVGVDLAASLPTSANVLSGSVSSHLVHVVGRACLDSGMLGAQLSLFACGLGRGGMLWLSAQDLLGARRVAFPQAAIGLRGGLTHLLAKSITLELFAEGAAQLRHTRLNVGTTEVWQTPAFMWTLGLAAGWIAP